MEKVTLDTLFERLESQEFRDFLSSKPHPVYEMDDSGYTFLDYVLFKQKQYGRPLLKTVNEINLLIDKVELEVRWHLRPLKTSQIN